MKYDGLKAGIFIDNDNLIYGQDREGLDYSAIIKFVEDLGMLVIRANTYMAVDEDREQKDAKYRQEQRKHRSDIRNAGFRVFEKPLKKYQQEDGTVYAKGNVDLELAVDALLQTDNLDYVLLGSGDGDFSRVVSALQHKGKKVEAFAFDNISTELSQGVDTFYRPDGEHGHKIHGFLKKNQAALKQPTKTEKKEKATKPVREIATIKAGSWREDKGFGFLTVKDESGKTSDLFFHVSHVRFSGGTRPTNSEMTTIAKSGCQLEFERGTSEKGNKTCAVKIIPVAAEGEFVEYLSLRDISSRVLA
ncbi:NYN domain-containing protein [Hahella sp. KA22]|uniref:LabA-like NYN domain-containing protein n=1 Tax=Hahella sp. KA22 TaxID=1628392 RepID=UPI000FDEC79B|nr:NYN domain-containing protein [Hahella sp. KA22]AZZ92472.1 NYN domain-containing protein [Hahella sp. KA22]QAY55846.1 NYN domain-containing protein [Hahella sp. KA22]